MKKPHSTRYFLLAKWLMHLFLIFALVNARAQSPDSTINHFYALHPCEEVYLQLDNKFYFPGDTVWYKAYVTDNGVPAVQAKNIYIDWVNDHGALIAHQTLPVVNGMTMAQYALPARLTGKKAHVMAYTSWMLTDGTDFVFHKDLDLLVQGSGKPEGAEGDAGGSAPSLRFFPEGGSLVASVEPNIVLLARVMAEKYFVNWPSAIGRYLKLDKSMTLKVTGVLDDPPAYRDFPLKPRYLIFLHNRFIEDHGYQDRDPSYGRAEYTEILSRFRKDGLIVISEKRAPHTNERIYAGKVVSEIDSLMRVGVKPENITVVGTSKGGYIAQFVSSISRNVDLNFVFIGSSFKEEAKEEAGLKLYGRILSITEASDTGSIRLSAQPRFKQARFKEFHEIVLHTGLHHGFLFKALDAWIVPTEKWAAR